MRNHTPLAADPDAIPITPRPQCRWDDETAVEEARPALENLARIVSRIADRRHAETRPADVRKDAA